MKKLIVSCNVAIQILILSPLSYGIGGTVVYDNGVSNNPIRPAANGLPYNFPAGTLVGGQLTGSVWRNGIGVPSNGLGAIGDYYLNDSNGDVYYKGSGGTYSIIANILGPQGIQGIQGIQGTTGPSGRDAGLKYTFSTSITNADPTTGKFKFNNATLASATSLYISNTDGDSNAISAVLANWDSSTTTTARGTLIFYKDTAPANFVVFTVSGARTDNSGWKGFPITYVTGGGTWANSDVFKVHFTRTGDLGATGTTGTAGTNGTNGTNGLNAGVKYIYSNDTANTDPTSTKLKFDSTTFSSVTNLRISNTDGDSNALSTYLSQWDASTSGTKGTLLILKDGLPANILIYNISGARTDNSGWKNFPLSYVASSGSFTNSDSVRVLYIRIGDKGDTGASGSGTGDVSSNTASSIDNELALFSGTGGKTIKRATTTGILKLTSGVIGTATAGTDYIASTEVNDTAFGSGWDAVTTTAPSKNAIYDWAHTFDTDNDGKVNVLDTTAGLVKTDANGVASIATAGTDYAAAPSGATANLPLFNNGSGGFTNGTRSGNTTVVATTTGSLTNGNCVKIDASGNLIDAGAVCGGSGGGLGFSGALTSVTTINATTTDTTGGVTLTNQTAANGSTWKVRAQGQYVNNNSATARNAQISVYWGTTQLTPTISSAVKTTNGSTWDFDVEFILNGTSTTAIWAVGQFHGLASSANIVTIIMDATATPASTTVTSGAQTIDLRFSMSNSGPTDAWKINSVTIERKN